MHIKKKRFEKENNLLFKVMPKSHQSVKYFAILAIFSSFAGCVSGKVYFEEEFSDGDKWQERWTLSEDPNHKWGFFVLTAGNFYGHNEVSKGIQTFLDDMRYGISSKFTPFSNKGKSLVLQFTVKHEQDLPCGGGYIKLFNCSLEPRLLNSKTPYILMFGPDRCIPTTLKIHAIFNYKGKYHEFKKQILYTDDIFTHLYTLIINSDNTYEIRIDNKDVAKGKLKDDWDFLPPEKITNYKAKKPKNWDDREFIPDPNDVPPKDWDQPEYIPDPTAIKPEDWDDILDGQWEPPLVENPNFNGEWTPRLISNPEYQGPWVQPKIRNPRFVDDPELYKFDEICAVGIEVFQAKSGSIFDNILITDDIDYAEKHGWKIWGSIKDAEKVMGKKWKKRMQGKDSNDEL